jgi:hypothetical protein
MAVPEMVSVNTLYRLRELSGITWRYYFLAIVLLPLVDISLRASGYGRTRQRMQRIFLRPSGAPLSTISSERLVEPMARGVSLAGRRSLWPTSCLRQALLLHVLLARKGIASDLKIGVRAGEAGGVDAHAWVERDGRVLIGGEHASQQYASLI